MAGWDTNKRLVGEEFKQSVEEGKDPKEVESFRKAWEAAGDDEEAHAKIHAEMLTLKVRRDFPYTEPSDLPGIRAQCTGKGERVGGSLSAAELSEKMHGAWLGRCVGCALGKPVEGFMGSHGGMRSWERQKTYLTAISPSEWPVKDYFPAHSPAEGQTGKLWCPDSTRERIAFMETDDDIRYTVLGQLILSEYGSGFLPSQVAATWLKRLPYDMVCTAETQAYRNIVMRYDLLRSNPQPAKSAAEVNEIVDWNWVTHHLNPYREWIGAQIRVDSYGYGAPGNPRLAAEWAFRDASISHVKNGIYGAMFCAAMIAAAFTAKNVDEVIEAGLAEIPSTSRLYADIRMVLSMCGDFGNEFGRFERVLTVLYDMLGHYNPVHTNNNAAACVVALKLCGGDFHKAVTLAVMAGWDTDCNGATVGSVVGAMAGARAIPAHWIGRLNDTLRSAVVGYDPIAISECARRSVELVARLGGARGAGR